jgi:hypothetical protein
MPSGLAPGTFVGASILWLIPAALPRVVAKNRAKESESPDMMAATEMGQALAVDRDLR